MNNGNYSAAHDTFSWFPFLALCIVFLGGSCNPTVWRKEIAIPNLEKAGVTFFNPVRHLLNSFSVYFYCYLYLLTCSKLRNGILS